MVLNSGQLKRIVLSGQHDDWDEDLSQIARNLPGHDVVNIDASLEDARLDALTESIGRLRGKYVRVHPLEKQTSNDVSDRSPEDLERVLRAIPLGNPVEVYFNDFTVPPQPIASQLLATLRVMRDLPLVYSLRILARGREAKPGGPDLETVLRSDDFMSIFKRPGPLCRVELNVALDDDLLRSLSDALRQNQKGCLRHLACVVSDHNQEGIKTLVAAVLERNAHALQNGGAPLLLELNPCSTGTNCPFPSRDFSALRASGIELSDDFDDCVDDSDTASTSVDGEDHVGSGDEETRG